MALACSAGTIRLRSWEFGSRVHYPAKERLLQPGRAHAVTGCAWSAKMLQPATSVRAAFI